MPWAPVSQTTRTNDYFAREVKYLLTRLADSHSWDNSTEERRQSALARLARLDADLRKLHNSARGVANAARLPWPADAIEEAHDA